MSQSNSKQTTITDYYRQKTTPSFSTRGRKPFDQLPGSSQPLVHKSFIGANPINRAVQVKTSSNVPATRHTVNWPDRDLAQRLDNLSLKRNANNPRKLKRETLFNHMFANTTPTPPKRAKLTVKAPSMSSLVEQGATEPAELPKNGISSSAPSSTGAGTAGSLLGTASDLGFKIYDTVREQQADSMGMTRFQSYGGENHPSGRPMGLSSDTDADKAANSRLDAEKSAKGIVDTVTSLGSQAAALLFESGVNETPDATLIADNEIDEDVVSDLITIHNTPQPSWDYTSRASRRYLFQQRVWDGTGINGGLINVCDLLITSKPIADMARSFRYVKWDSVIIGMHYETNGFYAGIGRIVYLPGNQTPTTITSADITRYVRTAQGVEFFANRNTEVELEIPYCYPAPLIETIEFFRAPVSVALNLLGTVHFGVVAPFQAPADVIQSINLQVTMRFNNLNFSIPQQIAADPTLEFQSGTGDFSDALECYEPTVLMENYILRLENLLETCEETGPILIIKGNVQLVKDSLLNLTAESRNLLNLYGDDFRQIQNNIPHGISWMSWFVECNMLIDRIKITQPILNSWSDKNRSLALIVSRYYTITEKRMRQLKAALLRLTGKGTIYQEHPLQFQSGEESSSIFYYPTSNRMQGRYRTTRLMGNYREGNVGASDTSIAHLTSIWCMHTNATWTVGSTDVVAQLPMSLKSWTTLPPPDEYDTMVTYLSTFASMWSGTFDLKFQISRSDFHQGKLLIAIVPDRTTLTTLSDATQHPHIIIDIAESNEFCIRVPNTNMRPLRYVINNESTADTEATSLGKLVIIPYAPLVKNSLVGDTVQVVVWIRGHQEEGPNKLRFYNPTNVSRLNRRTNLPFGGTLEFQSGEQMLTICEDTASGDVPPGVEEITDLKELLSRAQPFMITPHAMNYDITDGVSNFQPIGYAGGLEFYFYPPGEVKRFPNRYNDLIGSLFAFWNGDMDVMVQTNADILILRQKPWPINPNMTGNMSFGSGPGMIRFENATTMVTAKLSPLGIQNFYSRGYGCNATILSQQSITDYNVCGSSLVIDSYHSSDKRTASEALIYISASENFMLSSYVALPPRQLVIATIIRSDSDAATMYVPPTRKFLNLPPNTNVEGLEFQSGGETVFTGMNLGNLNPPRTRSSSLDSDDDTNSEEEDEPPEATYARLLNYADRTEAEERLFQRLERRRRALAMRRRVRNQTPSSSTFSRIRNVPDRILTVVESMASTTENIERMTRDMADHTDNIATDVEETTNQFLSWIKAFTNISPGDLTLLSVLIVDFIETICVRTNVKWMSFVTKLCLAIGLRAGALTPAFNAAYNYFMTPTQLNEGNNGLEFQADVTPSQISLILSLAVMALGMKSTGGLDDKKNTTMWELMAARGREANGMRQGVTAFTEGFKFVNDTIMEGLITYVYDDNPELKDAYSKKAIWMEMEQVSNIIKELHSYENLKFISYQPERRRRFRECYDRVNALRHKITMARNREMTTMFASMKSNMDELVSAAMDNSPNFAVRMDPAHYYIAGGPGMGKSAISTAFAKGILKSQKVPVENNIYCRTENAPFHDNYCHQYVYQIDDGNMVNDAEVAMEGIQRKSNVPMVLQMADLKKKGMYFTSKAIITTSNTLYPHITGITCNDALLRRRDVLIEAVWANQTNDGTPFDKTKAANFSHLRFNIKNPCDKNRTERSIKTLLTFEECLAYVIIHHGQHLAAQAAFVKGIQPDVPIDTIYTYTSQNMHTINRIFGEIVEDMANGPTLAGDFIVPVVDPLIVNPIELQGGGQSTLMQHVDRRVLVDDEESVVTVIQYVTIGVRVSNGYFQAHGMRPDGTLDIFEDLGSPMALAIIEEITRQANNVTLDEIRTIYNTRDSMGRRIWEVLRRPRSANAAAICRAWDQDIRAITGAAMDLVLTLPMDRHAAHYTGNEERYERTAERLESFQRSIDNTYYDLIAELPTINRIALMINRQVQMVPIYATAGLYVVIRKIGEQIAKCAAFMFNWCRSHPYLALIAGLVCSGMMYMMYKQRDKTTTAKRHKHNTSINLVTESGEMIIQDHHHKDVPDDGEKYAHVHLCEKCNMAYTHVHKKNSYEHSLQYDHLCYGCMKRKERKAVHDLQNGVKQLEIPTTEGLDYESIGTNSSPKSRNTLIRLEGVDEPKQLVHESVGTNSSPKQKNNVIRLEDGTHDVKLPKPGPQMTFEEATKVVNDMVLQHQASSDPNTLDIATKVFANQGFLQRGVKNMHYLGTHQRSIVIPHHIFLPQATSYDITITRLGMDFHLTIYEKHLKRSKVPGTVAHDEYLVLDLSDFPQIPSFADIRSLFVEEKDVGKLANAKFLLQTKTPEGTKIQRHSAVSGLVGETIITGEILSGFAHGIQYDIPTSRGDCGSVLFVLNAQIPGKIVGLHCMGYAGKDSGYSFLVTKERVNAIKLEHQCANAPPLEYLRSLCHPVDDCDLPSYTPEGRHLILGKLKTRQIPSPMKSDIIMSPLFDNPFPHTTEPVVLTTKDPRNLSGEPPLIKALKKFDNIAGGWNYFDRIICREHSYKEFLEFTQDYKGPTHILSLHEAINGIPGYIEPLNMRTSPGYPYILDKPPNMIGKSGFFNIVGTDEMGRTIYEPKVSLREDINEKIRIMKEEGWAKDNFYMDWLKDERRKLEKIKLGKSRMFNIHSLAWLLIERMYYGSALAAYQHASIRNGSTIGINMHGSDVTQLIKYLRTAGDLWWDLDVANFDGTADNEGIHDGLYQDKKWIRFHNPHLLEDPILDIVGETFFWRLHVVGTIMYIPFIGIPSGKLKTAQMDTEVNKQRRNKSWRYLCRIYDKRQYADLTIKRKLARDVGNGDDILGAVNEAVADFYNPINIADHWRMHGIEGTPPTKEDGGLVRGFRAWEQVTYLKCHFAHHEDYAPLYVAKMNIDTIKELANWIRTSSDDMTMLRSNIGDMERFLYAHGREKFNQYLGEVQSVMKAQGHHYVPNSYDFYDEVWRSQHEI